jgi:WD40 repeat protein
LIAVLQPRDSRVRSLAWSPRQNLLAVGSEHQVELWDGATDAQVAVLRGPTEVVAALAWSSQGQYLAATSEDGGIRIWDAQRRSLQLSLGGGSSPVFAVAWSPDDDRLVTGDASGYVQVWDARTGANLATWLGAAPGRFDMPHHDRTVYGVGWSPDGTLIASTRYDGLLQLWDAAGTNLAALPTNDKPNALAWSPRGDAVAVGDDSGACQFWNV